MAKSEKLGGDVCGVREAGSGESGQCLLRFSKYVLGMQPHMFDPCCTLMLHINVEH